MHYKVSRAESVQKQCHNVSDNGLYCRMGRSAENTGQSAKTARKQTGRTERPNRFESCRGHHLTSTNTIPCRIRAVQVVKIYHLTKQLERPSSLRKTTQVTVRVWLQTRLETVNTTPSHHLDTRVALQSLTMAASSLRAAALDVNHAAGLLVGPRAERTLELADQIGQCQKFLSRLALALSADIHSAAHEDET
jgi:hypothetical protein